MALVLLSALFILGGSAQSTPNGTATCLPSFGWMDNSREQSPCVVAGYLASVCTGEDVSLPPLSVNQNYLPNDASSCTCNTVLYSLVSACGACQDSPYDTWSGWSANCSNTSLFFFPGNIPSGTAVPGWAFLNVTEGDGFNPAAAQRDSGTPEFTGSSTPTSTIAETTTLSSSATSSSASPSASVSLKTTSHAGAIAGGVAGGVASLAALSVLVFWYLIRRRRRPRHTGATHSDFDAFESSVGHMSQQILAPTIPFQPRVYNSSSLVPLPRSQGTTIYTTYSAYQGSVADRYTGTSPDIPHSREEAPEI